MQSMFTEPYAAPAYTPFQQGWQGQHGWWQGGFGQPHGQQFQEIAQIVSAIVPAVVMNLQQSRFHQPYPQQPFGFSYQNQPPLDVAQIVNTVTPIVASLLQSRGYQGHFGQFMPRAA